MLGSKKIVCVIPARLQSSRFPKKVLVSLMGKPMLQWVWEAAHKNSCFDEIIFAVDAQETADLIVSFGGRFVMTSEMCSTGTDRVIEVARSGMIDGDIWVNWQGDEPFVTPRMINDLLQNCHNDSAQVWTLKKKIETEYDLTSPHVAKVVTDVFGNALYFSRSLIPYYRDAVVGHRAYFKHIGMYAFSKQALFQIEKFGNGVLETAEQLEGLRWLENGLSVCVNQTYDEVVGIDLPTDVKRAEEFVINNVVGL